MSRPRLLPVVACLLALGGCSDDGGSAASSVDLPFATYPTSSTDDGFDGAEVLGRLRMAAGCLVVRNEGDDLALVLPEGAADWDDRSATLRLEGVPFRLGSLVRAAGGAGSTTTIEACAGTEPFRVAPDGLRHAIA